MNVNDPQLLDCAHVGQLAGICQYGGCGNQICEQCTATCDTCKIVLCPRHQIQPRGHQHVFCPTHISRYAAKRLLSALSKKF